MREIRIRARAERDLIGIWDYSAVEWGFTTADNYLDALDAAIQSPAADPELGARRDDVRSGYRVLFVKRHAVYYTVTASTVQIVRILHGRMDPEIHL